MRFMSIKVLIADDHKIIAHSLKVSLERAGKEVVGIASNGREAVEMAEELQPHVVVMDLAMPVMDGVDAAKAILKNNRHVRVTVLSGISQKDRIFAAMKVGATAYVLKSDDYSELIRAIDSVLENKYYLSPDIAKVVVEIMLESAGDSPNSSRPSLTSREKEVLRHIADGHPTKRIADMLNVSSKTVESHRSQIMNKLGLRSVAELTRYALREGIVTS